jgi:hypothetical protein
MAASNHLGFQKMSPTENVVVGISAGIIEVTILQPMLYCKNGDCLNFDSLLACAMTSRA